MKAIIIYPCHRINKMYVYSITDLSRSLHVGTMLHTTLNPRREITVHVQRCPVLKQNPDMAIGERGKPAEPRHRALLQKVGGHWLQDSWLVLGQYDTILVIKAIQTGYSLPQVLINYLVTKFIRRLFIMTNA